MTAPLPSKESVPIRFEGVPDLTCRVHKGDDLIVDAKQLLAFIKRVQGELADAQNLLNSEWFSRVTYKQQMRTAQEERDRLRTALTGIQSCSTCEVCRGAATRALGDARRVACETADGLLKIHSEHESCEICSGQPPSDDPADIIMGRGDGG